MSKLPPTLADACAATLYDKSMPWTQEAGFHDVFRKVIHARKMVLDASMSAYLAELSFSIFRGGLRKRLRSTENLRLLSRLPHALTWVEFDNHAFIEHHRKAWNRPFLATTFGKSTIVQPDQPLPSDAVPPRIGWLLEQHGSAVRTWEIRTSSMKAHRVFINPTGLAWSTDDLRVPWSHFDFVTSDEFSPSEIASQTGGYINDKVCMVAALPRAREMLGGIGNVIGNGMTISSARDIWAFLATVNDLPIRIEHVNPSHGWMARGNYRKFLQHSVLTLTVPQSRWRQLVATTVALIRRRAHQVRGHWRRDWRHPGIASCKHLWAAGENSLTCRSCGAVSLWVHEHQRGDASLGFVTHDYEVVHKEQA
jgi:hypothetical protein